MLATPQHGWSQITIGDWSDRCSYIDDVPYLLLSAVDHVVRTYQPQVIRLDAEGWEYCIVFDTLETHIISDKCDSGFSYTTVECRIDDLATELIADIRRDLDNWANWAIDPTEDEVRERRADLSCYCDMIEKRISHQYCR